MIVTKLVLGTPLPILAVVASQAVADPNPVAQQPLPAWAAVLIAGIWAGASVLQMYGKLPGSTGGDRRKSGFSGRDREGLEDVIEVLTHEDADGVGRFVGHAKVTRELAETMNALATAVAEDRDARVESQRLTAANIEMLRSLKGSLGELHHKVDNLMREGSG